MKDMRHSPVAMFQIRAVWSMDAVATCNALGTSSSAIWTSYTHIISHIISLQAMHLAVKGFILETGLAAACKANCSSHNLPCSKLGSISIVWVNENALGATPAWSVLWARFLNRSKLPDATTSCAQERIKTFQWLRRFCLHSPAGLRSYPTSTNCYNLADILSWRLSTSVQISHKSQELSIH